MLKYAISYYHDHHYYILLLFLNEKSYLPFKFVTGMRNHGLNGQERM